MAIQQLAPHLRWRVYVVAAGLLGLLIILALQLLRWQLLGRDAVLAAAPQQMAQEAVLLSRGNILDRHGVLLATDVYRWDIGVSPNILSDENEQAIAEILAEHLDLNKEEILAAIKAAPEAKYVPLASQVDQATGEQINAIATPGLKAEPRPMRYYPQKGMAAHVLGFVNLEGRGYYGLEEFYEEFLTGHTVMRNVHVDATPLPEAFSRFIPSPAGRDLILTIDAGIQYTIERELARAIDAYGAKSGTIIVMDPKTGAILGLANLPRFDNNRYYEAPPSAWPNAAISQPYEPGSVVKALTVAAGLDSGIIAPDETFEDEGVIKIGEYEIKNSDRRGHGMVTLEDILAMSLNVGAAKISLKMGPEPFYHYLRQFGFGQVTEVDLAGELPGLVKDPNSAVWGLSDLATNAYGQGISVTPLQLIRAVAAIANDGFLVRPYVVQKMVDQGAAISRQPEPRQRAISPETARAVRDLMARATARSFDGDLVPGYKVAGKTGTAQVATESGYRDDAIIATYVAFLPADDPQVIMLVKIDEPTRSQWANEVAVPVFQNVARELVRLLDIPPDTVRSD
ncbi:MAG: penicillin-binding protein 2 [Anaerolineae bacterium]